MLPLNSQIIQTYGNFQFTVSEVVHKTSLIVFQNESVQWPVKSIDTLDSMSFSKIIEASPALEILLIGCGKSTRLIEPNLLVDVRNAGISIEPMDTGAACRTFNVLTAEDRLVAAALIPVS